MRYAMLVVMACGCGEAVTQGITALEDLAVPVDMMRPADMVFVPLPQRDFMLPPDMTGCLANSAATCTAATSWRCCSGLCEVSGGELECVGKVGDPCGSTVGNCSSGLTCFSTAPLGGDKEVCCQITEGQCTTDSELKQTSARCGTDAPVPFGSCYA